jgi:xanthine dehydrogenase YagR molybdenum-binding subunit
MGGAGHPPAGARIKLNADGSVLLTIGVQDIGTGTRTALAQIAAEELGVSLDKVSVSIGDTRASPRGPASAGSATLASLAPAVIEAAAAAKRAGEASGERGKNPKERSIRTCGAQCAEVEVDTETGEVQVLRVIAAHDCGRIVNPLLMESQVVGGITQALGYALSEERVVDGASGIVLNANLEEYKVPAATDVPEIINASINMPDEEANPSGAKGIGEPPIIPTAAAIANAIFDATGVRLRELPFKRERLIG